MPNKRNMDATTGAKLLKLFQRLMFDGRRHFQSDLAAWLNCSKQTVMRLTGEIENVIGVNLETGLENRCRWYRIRPKYCKHPGLNREELRYLSICRDLAEPYLPEQIRQRVDKNIFRFAMNLAEFEESSEGPDRQLAFFSKGRIDYSPHFAHIELLLRAGEEKRVCLVEYKAAGQTASREHRFVPGRMVSMSGALYALGASVAEDFQSMLYLTNLAVHRIRRVALTDKTVLFDIPDTGRATFGLPWHEPRAFRIRFTPGAASDYVRERIWAEEQKLEELDDGGVLLTVTSRSEPEIVAWVRGFGEEAELLP